MLNGTQTPAEVVTKENQEASASVFDGSEEKDTPIEFGGDYKGKNG